MVVGSAIGGRFFFFVFNTFPEALFFGLFLPGLDFFFVLHGDSS